MHYDNLGVIGLKAAKLARSKKYNYIMDIAKSFRNEDKEENTLGITKVIIGYALWAEENGINLDAAIHDCLEAWRENTLLPPTKKYEVEVTFQVEASDEFQAAADVYHLCDVGKQASATTTVSGYELLDDAVIEKTKE